MPELLDIVTERDTPTGLTTTKQQAHDNGHIHRIAAVLVFAPNGKLLVQRHKKWNRRLDHSVGGHVKSGEEYLAAAKREMEEELDLKAPVEKIDIVKPGNAHFEKLDPKVRHNYGVYLAYAPNSWRFTPNDEVDILEEMELGELVTLANKNPDKFLNGFLISLAAYLKATNSPLKIIAYNTDWGKL